MSAQTSTPDPSAPAATAQTAGPGFSFPTFLGGLVLGLVIGLFVAAYALPIIEPMLGTGPARTGAAGNTPVNKQPREARDPQPAPATTPEAEPKAADPSKQPDPNEKKAPTPPADATPKTNN